MVKISKLTPSEAEETFAKIPERKKGQWTELTEKVKKEHQAVEVSDITAGQAAALHRKCKEVGLRCKSLGAGKGVIILPSEPKK